MMKLSIFAYKTKPKIIAIVVFILTLIAISHYLFFNYQTSLMVSQANAVDRNYKVIMWKDIENLMNISIDSAQMMASDTAKDIVEDIESEYSDLSELEREFNSGNYNSPKFNRIIMKNIRGKYMYDIKTQKNSMFIISRTGILFDENVGKIETTSRDFDTEARLHFNTDLAYNSLEMIVTERNNTLIYYEPEAPEELSNHVTTTYPSRENLRAVYEKEGLSGLRGYEILVPAYITDDGDVFGTPDIEDNGKVNKNHKLIVVQRFNLYDVLQKLHYDEDLKQSLHNEECKGLENIIEFYSLSYVSIVVLDIIALMFLILYATKAKDETT